MAELAIVVGTYNRLDQIRQCIDSIRAQTKTPFRIYVTDAGSTDGTIEYLRSIASEQIIPIFVGGRLGQAKAYNDVFRMLDTPYVCWLSDDNVIVNRGLDVAVGLLEEDVDIGMVGLKTKDVRGPFVDAPYIGGVSPIGILNVNQGVLPTKVLKQVGGFSKAFRDYGIDSDLMAKVLYSGYDVVYTREVAIHHYRDWAMDQQSAAYAELMKKHERCKTLYEEKYGRLARNALAWWMKRGAWALFRKLVWRRQSMHSTRRVFGLIARDWHNIFTGRYISLLDPVRCAGKPYHLRQHCPSFLRPKSLPADPVTQTSG